MSLLISPIVVEHKAGDIISKTNGGLEGLEGDEDEEGGDGWAVDDDDLVLPPDLVSSWFKISYGSINVWVNG